MKVNELKPGDCITEQNRKGTILFEVIAIKQIGQRFKVTFQSALGLACADYSGEAWISATRG
ncbi:hypothetical protein CEK28_04445 [Xenophilus sp. AP218F]|nr:hypothetical protein CEK28_04445 [Xenophilus sp. AP218F]